MIHQTPVTTIVDFLRALEQHDETAALPTIAPLPSLVICGDTDMLTPHTQSESMAARLAASGHNELILVRDPGIWCSLSTPRSSTMASTGWSGVQHHHFSPRSSSGCVIGPGCDR
ncbi:putative alpha/beta fold hydrolase [Mycobacteroides abscessus subsp. abscessus]|nr:putative alpha/beta fold hydrolase [Mycobacteroides abscessus subsp. abscessus]